MLASHCRISDSNLGDFVRFVVEEMALEQVSAKFL
jgi:hypothetical protein